MPRASFSPPTTVSRRAHGYRHATTTPSKSTVRRSPSTWCNLRSAPSSEGLPMKRLLIGFSLLCALVIAPLAHAQTLEEQLRTQLADTRSQLQDLQGQLA